jgi:hypothetical protein
MRDSGAPSAAGHSRAQSMLTSSNKTATETSCTGSGYGNRSRNAGDPAH